MTRSMELTSEMRDGVQVVHAKGEIDLNVSPELRRTLLDALSGGHDLLVDLHEVGFIDSSGIASLVEALQAARRHGCRFALARVSAPALRVIRLAQLDRVFTLLDEIDPAFGGSA